MPLEDDLIVFVLFVAEEEAVLAADVENDEVTEVSSIVLLTWSFLDVAEIETAVEDGAAVEELEELEALVALIEALALVVDSTASTVLETATFDEEVSDVATVEEAVEEAEAETVEEAEAETVEEAEAVDPSQEAIASLNLPLMEPPLTWIESADPEVPE